MAALDHVLAEIAETRVMRHVGRVVSIDRTTAAIEGLSNELKTKLNSAQPSNLAQASRVDGMTPAALTLILARLRAETREKSA